MVDNDSGQVDKQVDKDDEEIISRVEVGENAAEVAEEKKEAEEALDLENTEDLEEKDQLEDHDDCQE